MKAILDWWQTLDFYQKTEFPYEYHSEMTEIYFLLISQTLFWISQHSFYIFLLFISIL